MMPSGKLNVNQMPAEQQLSATLSAFIFQMPEQPAGTLDARAQRFNSHEGSAPRVAEAELTLTSAKLTAVRSCATLRLARLSAI